MKAILSDEPIVDPTPDESSLTEAGILVVDEDPAFQLSLKTFLKEYVGFEKVFTASSGKEAIDLVNRESSIELLTVDFQMDEMDGINLLETLRLSAPRPLGVTMITGLPSKKLQQEFTDLKSSKLLTNHFLEKPVEFEKLEPVILESYEELKHSRLGTGPVTELENVFGASPFEEETDLVALATSNQELMAKLNLIEEKLERNARAMREMERSNVITSIVTDVLKLLAAATIAYIAWQSGLLTKINEKFNPPAPSSNVEKIEPVVTDPESNAPVLNPEPGEESLEKTELGNFPKPL